MAPFHLTPAKLQALCLWGQDGGQKCPYGNFSVASEQKPEAGQAGGPISKQRFPTENTEQEEFILLQSIPRLVPVLNTGHP